MVLDNRHARQWVVQKSPGLGVENSAIYHVLIALQKRTVEHYLTFVMLVLDALATGTDNETYQRIRGKVFRQITVRDPTFVHAHSPASITEGCTGLRFRFCLDA